LEYPEGFMVRYCTMFGNGAGNYAKWFGTRGTLDAKSLSPRQRWVANGEGSGESDKITSETPMQEAPATHHMQNFLDCVRSRKEPIAPIEAGYAHSVAVIMADEALTSGRRMTYDHARRELQPG
ncbi:MAG: Gfo/Idh/MocA family oxidoreductase, partial [Bryobacteraceae bacterium]